MNKYFRLMRPHQYIKNIFIFFPLFFGRKMTDPFLLQKSFEAFIAFCFISSAVYILNDYRDIEEDRKHPKKKYRPLASGEVSKRSALFLIPFLLIVGLSISFCINKTVFFLSIFYFVFNVFYTIYLKHISIIDVFSIAICFVIRIFVGSAVTMIPLSHWIVLTTFLLAVFLAVAKRRDDVLIFLEKGEKSRKLIDGYNLHFLDATLIIMSVIIVVSYIMYVTSNEVIARFHANYLYTTVMFVIMGLMRFMQITFVEQKSADPTEVLLTDKFIQVVILGWIGTFIVLIY